MSSANSLEFEDNPTVNNRPGTELWGKPTLTSDHADTCSFNKTFCFHFSESHIKDLVNCQIYHFVLI